MQQLPIEENKLVRNNVMIIKRLLSFMRLKRIIAWISGLSVLTYCSATFRMDIFVVHGHAYGVNT